MAKISEKKTSLVEQHEKRIDALEKKLKELAHKPTTLHECYVFQWRQNGQIVVGAQDRTDSDWLSACLNYRGRADEKDRIWWNDAMPNLSDIENYQLATPDNVRRLVAELISDGCQDIVALSVNVETRMIIFETKNDDNVIEDDLNF